MKLAVILQWAGALSQYRFQSIASCVIKIHPPPCARRPLALLPFSLLVLLALSTVALLGGAPLEPAAVAAPPTPLFHLALLFFLPCQFLIFREFSECDFNSSNTLGNIRKIICNNYYTN